MRPRPAALLTPPSQTPAFLQNVAKSCICHTSEKSPVTPIIASDPKTRSCKSCVCHTCDPLPPSSIASPSPLPSLATSHSPLPGSLARGCKFAPLFSSSCRMLPPQPFSFHAFAWLPGVAGGKHRRPAPVRTMFSFKNPCTVSPPSFPASGEAACGDSRISHQSPLTNHQTLPWSCADSPVRLELSAVNCQLSTRLTPVECAVPKKGGVRGSALAADAIFWEPRLSARGGESLSRPE